MDDFTLGANPPSYPSLRNIPLIATVPSDPQAQQFRNQLHMLSEVPCKWENPGLLDEAMQSVPLERIYNEASDEAGTLQATAESINKKPAWAYQDCVIRALLKWFKSTFFTWVNNPPCSRCGYPSIAKGMVAPTADEKALGGNRVELYQCSLRVCGRYERFPRYNDAFVLVQTRKGRCGEWVNCFGMLCRAMGSRVRWIWNSEDHVWIEVYSEYRKRWVHVDPCEAVFDKPLTYNEGTFPSPFFTPTHLPHHTKPRVYRPKLTNHPPGWHKPLAYCIAFSSDGATDVTRRYCRNPSQWALPRDKCPEANLLHILDEIRNMRRRNMPKDERFRLEGEDMREARELRHYYVSTVTAEVARIMPTGAEVEGKDGKSSGGGNRIRRKPTPAEAADAQKAAESRDGGRTSGNPDWVRARGEDGSGGRQQGSRTPERD